MRMRSESSTRVGIGTKTAPGTLPVRAGGSPNAECAAVVPPALIIKLTHMTYLLIAIAQSRPAGAHVQLRQALRRNRAHAAGPRRSCYQLRADSVPGCAPYTGPATASSLIAPAGVFRRASAAFPLFCCCALGCSGTNITTAVNFVSAMAPLAWFKALERRPAPIRLPLATIRALLAAAARGGCCGYSEVLKLRETQEGC